MGVSYLPRNLFFAPQLSPTGLFVGVEPHNKQQALEIIIVKSKGSETYTPLQLTNAGTFHYVRSYTCKVGLTFTLP